MNSNVIVTALLALVIVVFIVARQIIQRPVTQRSLLMALILSVALGGVFLVGHPAPEGIAAVIIGAVLGVGTGLVSGQVIRVWRDEATGIIFQRGGWRYLIVLIALLLARVLIRFVFIWSGSAERSLDRRACGQLSGPGHPHRSACPEAFRRQFHKAVQPLNNTGTLSISTVPEEYR